MMRSLITQLCLLAARLGIRLYGLLYPDKQRVYRFDIWLLPWIRRRRSRALLPSLPRDAPRDLLFCLVDHFEPGTRGAELEQARARFSAWIEGYPALARRFTDADGRHPQHSFFFPPHHYREEYLHGLAGINWRGFGEVDLHLHHGGDTSEKLRARLEECCELYARFGIFQCEGDPVRRRYAFIHGNWALDNSRPEYCGVNDELQILMDTGCYADFTFPSLHATQPRMVNTLYRALDDPRAPKSYDQGRPLSAGRAPAPEEFLLVTGPIGLRRRPDFPYFAVEEADVTGEGPGSPDRVRGWVRESIHVAGRPEWTFVKVHTHGAPEGNHDAQFGGSAALMYRTLCEEFNDGKRWRLHFVNAREMVNIARAAEDGKDGDAGQFRDYEIPPYLTRSIRASGPYRAERFLPAASPGDLPRLSLRLLLPEENPSLEFRTGLLQGVKGAVSALETSIPETSAAAAEAAGLLSVTGAGGELDLFLLAGCRVMAADGEGLPVTEKMESEGVALQRHRLHLAADQTRRLEILAGGDL